ncbi:hypothetical protein CCMSSC00406_0001071 [Pleurotus cornucopiae]|uniref:Uncharacterized protein n=1 Tax=Pleurotus cornucopiae TaxID=5321 RepID=A0ACB7ILK7_PLECO|nr:hypothetical protein CCMSSC00406_0001071 [Pleurotus cornucopiae]
MPEAITKVIYKPDPQSTEEYLVIVDHDQYKKWKEGDTTIALSAVVDCKLDFSIIGAMHTDMTLCQPSKFSIPTKGTKGF